MNIFNPFGTSSIILNWDEEGEKKVLKNEWYLVIEIDKSTSKQKNEKEIIEETEKWIKEFRKYSIKVPPQSYHLSGALGISLLTSKFDREHTNTDIAILSQKPILESIVSSFKEADFHLMRRRSFRRFFKSPFKFHYFHPTSVEEALSGDYSLRRNLELTRIDSEQNIICPNFSMQNHIKIYLHENRDGELICVEDKKPIPYPHEYFRGIPTEIFGEKIRIIDPRYIYTKLNKVVETHEKNYSKHLSDLEAIKYHLRRFQIQFPLENK